MALTLSEVMNIYPFSRAKLLAGRAGLECAVLSTNIQEVPDVERWLQGGEILFTSGYAFHGFEDGLRLIDHLLARKVTALVIKPSAYLPVVPQAMIAYAEEHGFPLFELPRDLPYMDCIIPIFEKLKNEQLFMLRKIEGLHGKLTETILRGEGLLGICQQLSATSGTPVFIVSPEGDSLAYELAGAYDEARRQSLMNELVERVLPERAGSFKLNLCNSVPLESLGLMLILVPIHVENQTLAYLVLDFGSGMLMETDQIALEHASSIIAIELLKERELLQKDIRLRGQLLEDILMHRYADETTVIRRGHYMGIDLTGQYFVFEIEVTFVEDTREFDLQSLKQRMADAMHAGFRPYGKRMLMMENGAGLVAVASIRSPAEQQQCMQLIADVVQQLKASFMQTTVVAGLGGVKKGVQDAVQSREEARLAIRTEKFMKQRRDIVRFDDLGSLRFLCELKGSLTMRQFYTEHMLPLLQYDSQNDADLIGTLKAYFKCDCNLRKTAEALFVHKNSVIYRLHKAQSLMGESLTDPEVKFNLQLCLKMQAIL